MGNKKQICYNCIQMQSLTQILISIIPLNLIENNQANYFKNMSLHKFALIYNIKCLLNNSKAHKNIIIVNPSLLDKIIKIQILS